MRVIMMKMRPQSKPKNKSNRINKINYPEIIEKVSKVREGERER